MRLPRLGVRGAIVCALVLGSGVGWATRAHAANPRSVPIGGRTATMGGAGTAAGNDSASPYLNPAGLAGLPGDVFAVSASVYGYSQRGFTRLFYPSGPPPTYLTTRRDETQVSASYILDMPSSVMYVKHLSAGGAPITQVAGMALVTPSRERTELGASTRLDLIDMAGAETQTISTSSDYADYYLGPAYAASFSGDRVRIGASVFALYTQWFRTIKFGSFMSAANGTILDTLSREQSRQARALSVVPVVGVQIRLAESLWAGVAVAAPSTHLWGELHESFEGDFLQPSGAPPGLDIAKEVATTEGVFRDRKPLRINAGVAWDDRKSVSLAADVHYYAARAEALDMAGTDSIVSYRSGEIPRDAKHQFRFTRDLVSALDVSAGAEVVLGPFVSLRCGGFTDMSNSPDIDLSTASPMQIREHRFGGTLGVGIQGGSFDSTIGVVVTRATGHFATFDLSSSTDSIYASVPTTENSVVLVLSGSVTTAEAKATIEKNSPIKLGVPGVN